MPKIKAFDIDSKKIAELLEINHKVIVWAIETLGGEPTGEFVQKTSYLMSHEGFSRLIMLLKQSGYAPKQR